MDGSTVDGCVGRFQFGGDHSWSSVSDRSSNWGSDRSSNVGSGVGQGSWQWSSIGSVGRHLLVGQRSLQDRVGQVRGWSIAVSQGGQDMGTSAHGDGGKDNDGELGKKWRVTMNQDQGIGFTYLHVDDEDGWLSCA